MDAVAAFVLDIVLYWVGVGVLKAITLGRFRRKDSQNPYLIGLVGLAFIVAVITAAFVLIRR